LALSSPATAAKEQPTKKPAKAAVAAKAVSKPTSKATAKAGPSKSAASKAGPKNQAAVRSAAPVETPRAVVNLEKGPVPTRTELGCSGENGDLSAVGQVMKVDGKTFRCQKTWDYMDGKLVGYPAWVELFMPTPGWGAGLRETPPPPAEAVLNLIPGASAKVSELADTQDAPVESAVPAKAPASGTISNHMF
jgi:hypothetical protein